MTPVIIALGSNLGDRLDIVQAGVDAITKLPGVEVMGVSPVYETAPVGGPEQPDYLNAVLAARTTLPPPELLDRLHEIETAAGRAREVRWGARTLDLDIIAYGQVRSDEPELTLPHPRAAERAFVLAPWHDLDPSAVLPGSGPVADLLAALGPDHGDVRRTNLTLRVRT
ncbi:MAG: 2-amino-4-hydroxy-6-hydroxymethyldihydropteridine diphosphokinase [Streptosporangiaceae bacterium]|jgi:2-amino-4-hydroxy-6-hydroxymethyldihydropteridine diphosphokinase